MAERYYEPGRLEAFSDGVWLTLAVHATLAGLLALSERESKGD